MSAQGAKVRDAGDTGILLLSGEGTVLARSGPPSMVGPRRAAIGYADLTLYFEAAEGVDLSSVVRELADGGVQDTRVLTVLPLRSDVLTPLRLTLHGIAPGLVVGVVARTEEVASRVDSAVRGLAMVWDGLAEGVAVAPCDSEGRLGRITDGNRAFATMLAVEPGDVRGQPLSRFLAPLHASSFVERVEQEVIRDGRSVSDLRVVGEGVAQEGAAHHTREEQSLLEWEIAPVRGTDGRTVGVVAVVRDVAVPPRTPVKRADLDLTSGLPNQVYFLSRLERSVERAAQARAYAFAILGLEMRGLRAVERRLGTLVANAALEALVRRLEQRLRPGDLVARTGDRRLTILLDHFAPWGALDGVLERLRAVTDAPYTIGGEQVTLSAVGAPGPIRSSDDAPLPAQEMLEALDDSVRRAQARLTEPASNGHAAPR